MIYLSSFRLSKRKVNNPNIYPYNVFRDKYIEPFVFRPITVLYGNNGSGKSTLLNIIANCLQLKGKEYATSNSFGSVDYCGSFSRECFYTLGEDDYGNTINKLPENSRYIKSEDILYEIKKIQQKQILSDGMEYDYVKRGMSLLEPTSFLSLSDSLLPHAVIIDTESIIHNIIEIIFFIVLPPNFESHLHQSSSIHHICSIHHIVVVS